MDEVQARREPVVITKNGKPVAKMVPVERGGRGSVGDVPVLARARSTIHGDIVAPMHCDEELEQMEAESMKVFDQ